MEQLPGAVSRREPALIEVLSPNTPEQQLEYPPRLSELSGSLSYRKLLRRHWKGVLVIAPLIGLAAGWLSAALQTPLYRARGALEIQDLNDNFLNMKEVLPVSNSSFSGALTDVQTQVRILQSDAMLHRMKGRMIARASSLLQSTPPLPPWQAMLRRFGAPSGDPAGVEVDRLFRTLHVRAVGQSRIIEVAADSSNPQLAAEFLNELCREFIGENAEARWKMSQSTGQWLARLLDEMRVKLRNSEDTLQQYARRSGLVFTSEKKSIAEEKLRQLQEELLRAEANRIAKQSRYEVAKVSAVDSVAETTNESLRREYEAKLADLRRQRAELATTYTDGETRIRRLDAQIGAIEAAFRSEQKKIALRIRNEFEEANRRERMVAADYRAQLQLVNDLAERAIQYNILQREADSNRQLYDSMLQRVKEATVATAMKSTNVRVVDPATPPEHPFRPKTLFNCALGMLTCCFGAALISLARERADSRVREPGETNGSLAVTELGVVPHDPLLKKGTIWAEHRLPEEGANRTQMLGLTKATAPPGVFEIGGAKHALVLESYRAVVTSLLFSSPDGRPPRVVVVTSPGPGEGKTTVAANLAVILAGIGRRVLLVEGDLRRHRLSLLFGLDNACGGLTTLLQHGALAETRVEDLVHGTQVPLLDVLTGGPSLPDSPNLLHSAELPALLSQLREKYDIVLIDTPPVLQIADARLMGRLSDGVVLVARAGRTTREALTAANQRLCADGTTVLGMILNDWNPKASSVGYYGYTYREYMRQ